MHTFSVRVQSLSDVLQCLEEAIQVHLSVFGAPYDILVDQVIVGLRQGLIRHGLKLRQPLELVASDEVVRLLAG
jgi:hypothetical protein